MRKPKRSRPNRSTPPKLTRRVKTDDAARFGNPDNGSTPVIKHSYPLLTLFTEKGSGNMSYTMLRQTHSISRDVNIIIFELKRVSM